MKIKQVENNNHHILAYLREIVALHILTKEREREKKTSGELENGLIHSSV
jgi:hypothetical protein